eukprot:g6895.t1
MPGGDGESATTTTDDDFVGSGHKSHGGRPPPVSDVVAFGFDDDGFVFDDAVSFATGQEEVEHDGPPPQQAALAFPSTSLLKAYGFDVLTSVTYRLNLLGRTEKALTAAYEPMEFDLAPRVGYLLNLLCSTVVFAPGCPVLLVFACLNLWSCFHVDKFLLLRVCKEPPQYDAECLRWALHLVFYAMLAHGLMGMWMLGNQDVFPSEHLWKQTHPTEDDHGGEKKMGDGTGAGERGGGGFLMIGGRPFVVLWNRAFFAATLPYFLLTILVAGVILSSTLHTLLGMRFSAVVAKMRAKIKQKMDYYLWNRLFTCEASCCQGRRSNELVSDGARKEDQSGPAKAMDHLQDPQVSSEQKTSVEMSSPASSHLSSRSLRQTRFLPKTTTGLHKNESYVHKLYRKFCEIFAVNANPDDHAEHRTTYREAQREWRLSGAYPPSYFVADNDRYGGQNLRGQNARNSAKTIIDLETQTESGAKANHKKRLYLQPKRGRKNIYGSRYDQEVRYIWRRVKPKAKALVHYELFFLVSILRNHKYGVLFKNSELDEGLLDALQLRLAEDEEEGAQHQQLPMKPAAAHVIKALDALQFGNTGPPPHQVGKRRYKLLRGVRKAFGGELAFIDDGETPEAAAQHAKRVDKWDDRRWFREVVQRVGMQVAEWDELEAGTTGSSVLVETDPEFQALVDTNRVVVLKGAPGTGKTVQLMLRAKKEAEEVSGNEDTSKPVAYVAGSSALIDEVRKQIGKEREEFVDFVDSTNKLPWLKAQLLGSRVGGGRTPDSTSYPIWQHYAETWGAHPGIYDVFRFFASLCQSVYGKSAAEAMKNYAQRHQTAAGAAAASQHTSKPKSPLLEPWFECFLAFRREVQIRSDAEAADTDVTTKDVEDGPAATAIRLATYQDKSITGFVDKKTTARGYDRGADVHGDVHAVAARLRANKTQLLLLDEAQNLPDMELVFWLTVATRLPTLRLVFGIDQHQQLATGPRDKVSLLSEKMKAVGWKPPKTHLLRYVWRSTKRVVDMANAILATRSGYLGLQTSEETQLAEYAAAGAGDAVGYIDPELVQTQTQRQESGELTLLRTPDAGLYRSRNNEDQGAVALLRMQGTPAKRDKTKSDDSDGKKVVADVDEYFEERCVLITLAEAVRSDQEEAKANLRETMLIPVFGDGSERLHNFHEAYTLRKSAGDKY